MMLFEMYLLSNMAILCIHVSFQGGYVYFSTACGGSNVLQYQIGGSTMVSLPPQDKAHRLP